MPSGRTGRAFGFRAGQPRLKALRDVDILLRTAGLLLRLPNALEQTKKAGALLPPRPSPLDADRIKLPCNFLLPPPCRDPGRVSLRRRLSIPRGRQRIHEPLDCFSGSEARAAKLDGFQHRAADADQRPPVCACERQLAAVAPRDVVGQLAEGNELF